MNPWVKKSFKLAEDEGYLDNIFKIYEVGLQAQRKVSENIKSAIRDAHKRKNKPVLLENLLDLPKFPIDDPYVASIRKYRDLIIKNPKTAERIANKILSMDAETVLRLAETPKSGSRQMGASFKTWLYSLGISVVDEQTILKTAKTSLLAGNDKVLAEFSNKYLGSKFKGDDKGVDFVIKTSGIYVVGEAKFITAAGGGQSGQFNTAMYVANQKSKKAIFLALLDGIIWYKSKSKIYKTLTNYNGYAMSALLLQDFIKSLSK